MSTMQSTVRRVEEDETRTAEGWQPAGPALTAGDTIGIAEIERGKDWLASNEDMPRRSFPNLPSIGHLVVYHLRDGDSRNMRTKFPAVVLDVDQSTGLLSLIITVDAGDEWRQDHVPPRVAPEPGWELVESGPNELSLTVARLGDRVAALENHPGVSIPPLGQLEGDIDRRPGAITWAEPGETLAQLTKRIEALETAKTFHDHGKTISLDNPWQQEIVSRLNAIEAKRPPGRPPKPKDE